MQSESQRIKEWDGGGDGYSFQLPLSAVNWVALGLLELLWETWVSIWQEPSQDCKTVTKCRRSKRRCQLQRSWSVLSRSPGDAEVWPLAGESLTLRTRSTSAHQVLGCHDSPFLVFMTVHPQKIEQLPGLHGLAQNEAVVPRAKKLKW